MNLTKLAVQNKTTVYVIVTILAIFGVSSYRNLPREANPDVTIPVIIVQTPYPGVSPQDIESLVTNHIEREVKEVKKIKKLTSSSYEGASVVVIEFLPDANIDEALQQVRDRVNRARQDLPKDAEESDIREISFSDFPIMYVTFTAPYSLVRLKDLAEDVQEEIEAVKGVLDVKLTGGLEREIQVQVDPSRLAFYELSMGDVTQAINSENINIPGGNIKIGGSNYLVRTPGEFTDPLEIEDLVIRKDNSKAAIRVRDVARVVDTFKERANYSRLDNQQAVTLKISKRVGENIVRVIDDVKALLDELQPTFPPGTKVTILNDQSTFVRRMVSDLENNIYTALVLVIAVIMLTMGLRNSLIVATVIPLSMLFSYVVLNLLGWTLNIVVLFSLILALGMLVDNAVVIVENIYRHRQEGKSADDASIEATNEVAMAVTSSTLTTLAAFFPLMFWPGIVGQFMAYLPAVVIIVLSMSLFVGLWVNPVLSASLMKVEKAEDPSVYSLENPAIPDNVIYRAYKKTLEFAIRHALLTTVAMFGFLVLSILLYAKFQHGVQFFPETVPEKVMVTVKGPEGMHLDETNAITLDVEKAITPLENVKHFIANPGQAGDDMGGGAGVPQMASLAVDFRTGDEATENAYATIEKLREGLKRITGADVTVQKENMGPPTGDPVAVEIIGEDLAVLEGLTREVRAMLQATPGVVDLKDDYNRGKPEIQVLVDRIAARKVGASIYSIADTIRAAFYGAEASKFREGKDEYDITVILREESRKSINDIMQLTVPGRDGIPVPLTEVANVVTQSGFGAIRHLDRKRVVTVGSNVEGRLPDDVLKELRPKLEAKQWPKGYSWKFGGEQEDQAETQAFLGMAFWIAVAGVFLILVSQFNSILYPIIIMSSVILSMSGVLMGLLITFTPFGIVMTGIGVISLAGIAVNNAIVLIDYAEYLRKHGIHYAEAIKIAGMTRLRPVFLTAGTTVLGLVPMAIKLSFDFYTLTWSMGGQSAEFWQPMAVAVIFGLTIATFLTLVVVPSMYVMTTRWSESAAALWGRLTKRGGDAGGGATAGEVREPEVI